MLCRYQINARSELAVKYNDVSPLENHHWAKCIEILSSPETNIFDGLSKAQMNDVHRVKLKNVAFDTEINMGSCRT